MDSQVCLIFTDDTRFCWDFDDHHRALNWAEELMAVFPGQWEGPFERQEAGYFYRAFNCISLGPLNSIEISLIGQQATASGS